MISPVLNSLFDSHVSVLAAAKKRRREDLALKGALEVYTAPNDAQHSQTAQAADEDPEYGLALPDDVYEGDAHLRTLNRLLAEVDKRGFERSESLPGPPFCPTTICSHLSPPPALAGLHSKSSSMRCEHIVQ